jgi:predicted SAM-dependent methyltransferase
MMTMIKKLFRPLYAPIVTQYRNQQRLKAQQNRIRAHVASMQNSGHPLQIVIGAGETKYTGWIPTDIPAFDILKHTHWAQLFQPNSIHRMLAEHVFEHLTTAEMKDFLRIARIYLTENGRIRIAVPDGYHPDPSYIEHVRPGGIGIGADDHKVLYTCDLIAEILEAQGYNYQVLEGFNADGEFQRSEWDIVDGYIKRSEKYDDRNKDGKLAYTSLIVDCWVSDRA